MTRIASRKNRPSTAPLRILVVGAGVGGISVARGLLRDGHDVTVFEQRPDVRASGGAVTIWSNGETVLRQLGVEMDGAGQLLSTVRAVTSRGRPLATLDVTAMVDRLGAPVRMVPRRVLLERLLEGFPTDRIRCNSRALTPLSAHNRVRLEFDDGSSAEGDLLIGADGLHSVVRESVGAQDAKPTGWCSWQGLVTLPEIPDEHAALMIIGEHGNLGLWPAGGSDVQWWFDLPWSSDFVRPQRPIDMIRSNFTGWADPVDRVLAILTDDDLGHSPYPHFRHPIPRAGQGPVTLLGDAAHTMPPTLAQGTNQALLDTMVLCKALSDLRNGTNGGNADLSTALRRYEKTRRRKVMAVSWVASLPVSHGEAVLRPAALISDRLQTSALTMFLRWTSHRRMSAEISRKLGPAAPPLQRMSIELCDVVREYRVGGQSVRALDEISLRLAGGQFVSVVGPSGAGKSTLLHLLGALDSPDSGSITFDGEEIGRLGDEQQSEFRHHRVGFIFQFFNLLPTLSAWENVAVPKLLDGVRLGKAKRDAVRLLDRVGLGNRTQHRPAELSGGQMQRVAVARALMMDPPLILADEPTGNLDSTTGSSILALLAEVAHEGGRGRLVVMVTHNSDAAEATDRVITLQDGRVGSDVTAVSR